MPKETVRGNLPKGSEVSVGWSQDQDVQLGVTLGSRFVFVDKSGIPLPDEEVYGSLWFTFEHRRQINDLIRNLRKARDSAFGKDE